MLLPPFLCKKRSNDLDQLLDIFLIDLSNITNTEGIQVSQLSGIDRVAAFLDVLIKLRKLKGDIGGIEEGGNDRSLVSAVNIGGEAERLHFLDQQTVIFCVPLAAGRDPALGIQLLQCLGEGQDNAIFHLFPYISTGPEDPGRENAPCLHWPAAGRGGR